MNIQQEYLADWIVGTFGTDISTACIIANSYTPEELEDIEYVKEELISWKKRDEIMLEMGIFKKI